jgi:hypothetical protein
MAMSYAEESIKSRENLDYQRRLSLSSAWIGAALSLSFGASRQASANDTTWSSCAPELGSGGRRPGRS